MDMSRSGNYEVKKQNIDVTKLCDTIIDRVRGNFIHEDKAIVNDINIKSKYIYANENDLHRNKIDHKDQNYRNTDQKRIKENFFKPVLALNTSLNKTVC